MEQVHPHNKADRANMEFGKLDADVQAFIQTGIKNYGHVDAPGDYAWLTPMIMKYGVELTCGNLFLQGPGDQTLDPLPNAATLKKILSTGPPVRKLFIGHIRLPEFEFAFRTKDQCPSLKEVCFEFVACNRGPVHLNDCGPFQGLCSLQLCAGGTSTAYAEDIASYLTNNRSLKELTLRMSCGGDEGISIFLEALKANDTLKRFSLLAMALTFDNLISFAKMLPSNSTLELVTLDEVCKGEEDELALCLDQGLYPGAFNRLDFSWRDTLFNKLTALTRKEGCAPRLHVCVPSLAGKKDIRRFFESLPPVTTLYELHLRTTDDICDPYTDGIAYLLKRTSSLREIIIRPSIPANKENNLLSVFDALKKNRSVTKFSIETEEMTPRIAAVLSELVAVNSTLNDLTVYPLKFMLRERVLMIEKGFRMNHTLTKFDMGRKGGDEEQRIGELLKRNITLENKAAMCVISGVEASDTAGLDALSKVHSGTGLVKKVQMITGRTREEALDDIEKAVARLPL